jgi:hypothetical protein
MSTYLIYYPSIEIQNKISKIYKEDKKLCDKSLSVICSRSVVFFGYSGPPHQKNWPPRNNWNIVEIGIKHHNPNPKHICIITSKPLNGK